MEIERLRNSINGEWVESRSKEILEVRNPAMDEVIAEVPMSTDDEVKEAIEAAKEAFPERRRTPPVSRAR